MNNCQHKWKTRKYIEEHGDNEYKWTHCMECIKCGAYKTIIFQEEQDKTKTE